MDENDKNKKIDKVSKKITQLDDVCASIYLTLMASKNLRYNELFRTVNKLNPKQKSGKDFISKPTFDEHLVNHLKKKHKLVTMKKEGKQNVTYSLNKDAMSILTENVDSENMEKWLKEVLYIEIKRKDYQKLTEEQFEQEVNRDINEVLKINLRELKSFINYDLKTVEQQSDTEFWNFVGNPLYRMLEKGITEKCRESIKYRTKIFEKMEFLLRKRPLLRFDDKSED